MVDPLPRSGSARRVQPGPRSDLGPVTRGAFDEPGRPPFQLDESHRWRDMTRWAGLDDVTSQVIPWTCEIKSVQSRALCAYVTRNPFRA